jgi:hypothetical protein
MDTLTNEHVNLKNIHQNNINQKDFEIQALKQKIDTTTKEHVNLKMIQQNNINQKDL